MTTQPRPDTAGIKAAYEAYENSQTRAIIALVTGLPDIERNNLVQVVATEMPALLDYIKQLEAFKAKVSKSLDVGGRFNGYNAYDILWDLYTEANWVEIVAPGSQQPQSTGGE